MCTPSLVGPVKHARRRTTDVVASSRGLVLTNASMDVTIDFAGRPASIAVDRALQGRQIPAEQSLATDADSPHIELPQITTEPTYGLSPELIASLVMQRAHTGGVAMLCEEYLDRGFPTPGYLAELFDELTDTGLLALTDKDPWGLRRITLTAAEQARDMQLRDTAHRAGTRSSVQPQDFGCRRSNSCPAPLPAPGGQPDPSPRPSGSSVEQLRWVRCLDDKHLHLLHPADVLVVAGGHAPAVCGQRISAEGLTITRGPSGALCMTCVVGATSPDARPRPGGTS